MPSRKLRIGKIVGFRGLRGEIKLRCETDSPDWLDTLERAELVLQGRHLPVEILSAKSQGGMSAIVRFREFSDRTAAEAWLNAELMADEADLPAPEEGEYRVDELLGLTVVDHQTGQTWGVVKDLLSSGGMDFLELQLEGKPDTVVVPFNDPFFPVVDVENRQIHVALLGDFLAEQGGAPEGGKP